MLLSGYVIVVDRDSVELIECGEMTDVDEPEITSSKILRISGWLKDWDTAAAAGLFYKLKRNQKRMVIGCDYPTWEPEQWNPSRIPFLNGETAKPTCIIEWRIGSVSRAPDIIIQLCTMLGMSCQVAWRSFEFRKLEGQAAAGGKYSVVMWSHCGLKVALVPFGTTLGSEVDARP